MQNVHLFIFSSKHTHKPYLEMLVENSQVPKNTSEKEPKNLTQRTTEFKDSTLSSAPRGLLKSSFQTPFKSGGRVPNTIMPISEYTD